MKTDNEGAICLTELDALLIVDAQMDFMPGGALTVPDGDAIIPVLCRYIHLFHEKQLPVIATRDWHPADHCSFMAQGGPWPPHCVAGSSGTDFAEELGFEDNVLIISKATAADRDAYSGFDGTDLHDRLQQMGVRRLLIGGLATDYCVLRTVMDALDLGYEVFLLLDAIRAVEVNAGDGDQALGRMREKGAMMIKFEWII